MGVPEGRREGGGREQRDGFRVCEVALPGGILVMLGQGNLGYVRAGEILVMLGQGESWIWWGRRNLGDGRAGGILDIIWQGESWIW